MKNGDHKGKGMGKALIFDSSTIISLSMNSLLGILEKLRTKNFKFIITPHVKHEIIDHPLKIKRFELEALMILDLVKRGIIEVVDHPDLEGETQKILETANSSFLSDGEGMRILDAGEASCFALHNLMKCECLLAIDERTARMLSENPDNLRALFEKKLHRPITMKGGALGIFKDVSIIRSAELCIIAYEKKLISLPAPPQQAIDALLFGVKLKGCSISHDEIAQAKRMFK